MKRKQVFTDLGFIQEDGKSFVNETFTVNAKRVLETADTEQDLLIIGSILNKIVGDLVLEKRLKMNVKK